LNREIQSLTALRGIAAMGVLAFHAGAPMPGYLCVDLFFMLSGFVLMHAYGERFATSVSGTGYRTFLRARLARIYPVHLLTILLLLPLYGHGPSFSGLALVHNLLLTQAPWYGASWNVGAWSISAEWHAYLIFPFLAVMIGARSRIATIGIGFLCLGIVSVAVSVAGSANIAYTPAVFLRCLPEFIIGMVLYRLYRQDWLFPLLRRDRSFLAAAAAVAVLGCVKGTDTAILWIFPILLIAAAANQSRGSRILNSRPLRYLGKISYSLYMVQMLSQFVFLEFLPNLNPIARAAALIALSFAMAIPISRFVEYPARDWLRAKRVGQPTRWIGIWQYLMPRRIAESRRFSG